MDRVKWEGCLGVENDILQFAVKHELLVENVQYKKKYRLGKKVIFRHTDNSTDNDTQTQKIKDNLENLKRNMSLKQRAQEYYYEKSYDCTKHQVDNENKIPVHARLGSFRPRRRIGFDFNPKFRNKRNKIFKGDSGGYVHKWRIYNNYSRFKRNAWLNPVNYRIFLRNEGSNEMKKPLNMHSIPGSLTLKLQQEIKLLQIQNTTTNIIPNVQMITVDYGYTGISLNNRFSSLP
ncbi:hypothetical protein FQA39_LY09682 [Lamprigera yunnana]|nr:hypothetical protein FQA39_LY09682 [Lamprigera yunnana]